MDVNDNMSFYCWFEYRGIIKEQFREDIERAINSLMVYDSPIVFPEFGQIWHKTKAERSYFTYSELFGNGDSVEWLTASHINEFPSPEECGEIQPFYALVPVFAGD